MHPFAAEGIILKRKNFGEADKLVTIFSKNHGKIVSVAKGVRKITSRRASSLELLNHVKVSFHQTKGLPILTEAQIQNTFPDLKEDLNKISIAFLVLELVDRLFDEGQENKIVFDLLLDTIGRIDSAQSLAEAKKFQTSFQIKLLTQVGYLPQLYNCVSCERKLIEEKTFLSPNSGGLVDDACNQSILLSKVVAPDEVKVLRFLNNESFSFVERLKLDEGLLNQASELLNYYTIYFLERNLNSIDFA
ncbi:MAG: DNA repair protein RecO, partial [Candidatus Magasanikbacteria bacterium]|nr:DNA repair protein RecO [Candidatus Magasanikbacteria bacterium]